MASTTSTALEDTAGRADTTALADTAGIAAWSSRTFGFLAAMDFAPEGQTLLLGVSGGADSVALLDFWVRLGAPRFGCRVLAAHVNHGLRAASAADQAFVERLCGRLGVPLFLRALEPAQRPPRESVEMWARRERYLFFGEKAREAGADWVLTGHHRDDLVETVFQRLGRGTGPVGLGGIPFRRKPGIVRPFLDRSREDILRYLELAGQPWREDESNADLAMERNWYRHRYLPGLRPEVPDLDERVFRLAMDMQAMRAGLEVLEDEADRLRRDGRGRLHLPAQEIDGMRADGDTDALRFWFRRLMTASSGPAPMVTKGILLEFLRQWEKSPQSVFVQMSAKVALKREKDGIYCIELASNLALLAPSGLKMPCPATALSVILETGCETGAGSGGIAWRWGGQGFALSFRIYLKRADLPYPEPWEGRAIFDADLFSCTLVIRTRNAGDRFSPLGVRSRSRKLKTFFNEEKIPIEMRDAIPIITSGDTLAWVPGHGISEFFKVSGKTTRILELVLACENP